MLETATVFSSLFTSNVSTVSATLYQPVSHSHGHLPCLAVAYINMEMVTKSEKYDQRSVESVIFGIVELLKSY